MSVLLQPFDSMHGVLLLLLSPWRELLLLLLFPGDTQKGTCLYTREQQLLLLALQRNAIAAAAAANSSSINSSKCCSVRVYVQKSPRDSRCSSRPLMATHSTPNGLLLLHYTASCTSTSWLAAAAATHG